MDNTRFITAIEDPNGNSETKADLKEDEPVQKEDVPVQKEDVPVQKEETVQKKDEEQPADDLIQFGTDDAEVETKKPRPVDRFFANQTSTCLLSPIKSSLHSVTLDQSQESLELKLDSTDYTNRARLHQCIQPNDSNISSTNVLDDIRPTTEDGADTSNRSSKDSAVGDSLHFRKRLQEEMEPAVFDVPRATKMPHREKSVIPEFCENSAPVLQFTSETGNLFKPEIDEDKNDPRKESPKACDNFGSTNGKEDLVENRKDSQENCQDDKLGLHDKAGLDNEPELLADNELKVRHGGEARESSVDNDASGKEATFNAEGKPSVCNSEGHGNCHDDADVDGGICHHDAQGVCLDSQRTSYAEEYVPNRGFNITLDMTLRTSGGVAFASGLFLAIDEFLDPLVGAVLPYGGRRRGVNVIVVCLSLLVAVYLLFYMS